MGGATLRERQQERSRADLVEATLAVIAADGLPAVTIEAILRESGMARATLYAHFPGGRDELLRAAYARAGEELLRLAREAAATASGWRTRILAFARTMIDFSSSPTLGHFYSVSGPHLMGFRAERGVGSQGYFDAFRAALGEAAAAGELVAGADPDALAILLTSSLRDAGIAVARGHATAGTLVAAVETLLEGLAARPAARPH